MGLPKAFHSSTYFISQSIDTDTIPSACPVNPVTLIIPTTRVCIAILNPALLHQSNNLLERDLNP